MAERGGQPGNQNNVKGKRWQQAIDRALAKRCKGDGIAALDELAERLLQEAQAGEGWALKELGDRIDGKAAQSIGLIASVTTKKAADLTDDELAEKIANETD